MLEAMEEVPIQTMGVKLHVAKYLLTATTRTKACAWAVQRRLDILGSDDRGGGWDQEAKREGATSGM